MGSSQTAVNERVFLNVYDLHPTNDGCCLYNLGYGFYHSGVQIRDQEFTFSQDGIIDMPPRTVPPEVRFRQTIEIGSFHGNADAVRRALSDLAEDFRPGSYHILKKNCNTFSNALCLKLAGASIPGYVNRLANIAAMFPAFWPKSLRNAAGNEAPVSAGTSFKAFSGSGHKMNNGTSSRASSSTQVRTPPSQVEMERVELMRRQRLAKFEERAEATQKDR